MVRFLHGTKIVLHYSAMLKANGQASVSTSQMVSEKCLRDELTWQTGGK